MNRKRIVSILALILVITMLLGLVGMVLPLIASASTTQAEIDALQAQRDQIQTQQSGIQATINALSSQQASYQELKEALDEKNRLTLMQIQNVEEQIALHEQLIGQKTSELEQAQKTADDQLAKFKKRVRAMEEAGKYNYLEVLLGAHSISEFLSLIDDITDIMKSDRELEARYRAAVEDLRTAKAELEAAQDEMKSKKAQLVELSDQLQQDIASANETIASLQADINANAAQLSDLEAQEAEFQTQIDALVAKREEERRQAELEEQRRLQQQQSGGTTSGGSSSGGSSSGGGKTVGTGSLAWPVNCPYITSRYGMRVHPISGEYKNHGGIDIGASYGSPIYASDGGTVTTSSDGWNSGYGNYVIIDHGNGYVTLYAHMSSRACSVGDSVSQGQVIGYVGSSGNSTGAHLHFEVYAGGGRTDPLSYFSWMSFTYSASA